MTSAILLRWSHFKKECITTDDAQVIWKARLRTHFKNARGRCKNIAEITEKQAVYGKRKYQEENRVVKRQHALWGMKNFLPDYPEGEDERSMELHMSRIQKIQRLSREKQDKLQIKRLMEITFSHRRRLLVTKFCESKSTNFG